MLVGAAHAASAACVMSETPCREYARTPVVFQGLIERVTTVDYDSPWSSMKTGGRLWHVKVERQWKGLAGAAEVELLTFGTPGKVWVEDEIDFKIGERYVIWASPSDRPPALRAHGCSLTRPLNAAQDQVEFLESLSRPEAGGYVYGRVWGPEEPSTAEGARNGPSLTVVLEGTGVRRETRTDEHGRFRFAGLREGHYEVYLVLPDTLAPFRQSPANPHYPRTEMPIRTSVAITGPRDCASADFNVQSSSLMSGFAATSDGKPLPGIIVQAVLLNHLQEQDENRDKGRLVMLYAARAITDERGYFEFLNVSPGRYVVGVTLRHDPNEEQPFPRLFHPGVADVGEAIVFDLKPGARLDVGVFDLPPPLVPFPVHGLAVRENGEPAADALVTVTNNRKGGLRGARTGKDGAFSLSLFPGYSYVLTATLGSGQDALVGRATYSPDGSAARPTQIRIELRPRSSGSGR